MEIRITDIVLSGLLVISSYLTFFMIKRTNQNKESEKCVNHSERLIKLETIIPSLNEKITDIKENIRNIFKLLDKRNED